MLTNGSENIAANFTAGAIENTTEPQHTETAARKLSGLLIRAMETERARLARELHDDLSQRLALLSIKLTLLDTSDPDAIAKQVQSLLENIDEIANEVRRLSHQLHPSTLENLGLETALRGFCREVNDAYTIQITLDCGSLPRTVPSDVSLCIFRITQEAVRNAVKHSGAREVIVIVKVKESILDLTVTDDGRGFDQNTSRPYSSLGLISMNERITAFGGSLTIDSAVGTGTKIGASIDLSNAVQG